jgi:hypothetical protein
MANTNAVVADPDEPPDAVLMVLAVLVLGLLAAALLAVSAAAVSSSVGAG